MEKSESEEENKTRDQEVAKIGESGKNELDLLDKILAIPVILEAILRNVDDLRSKMNLISTCRAFYAVRFKKEAWKNWDLLMMEDCNPDAQGNERFRMKINERSDWQIFKLKGFTKILSHPNIQAGNRFISIEHIDVTSNNPKFFGFLLLLSPLCGSVSRLELFCFTENMSVENRQQSLTFVSGIFSNFRQTLKIFWLYGVIIKEHDCPIFWDAISLASNLINVALLTNDHHSLIDALRDRNWSRLVIPYQDLHHASEILLPNTQSGQLQTIGFNFTAHSKEHLEQFPNDFFSNVYLLQLIILNREEFAVLHQEPRKFFRSFNGLGKLNLQIDLSFSGGTEIQLICDFLGEILKIYKDVQITYNWRQPSNTEFDINLLLGKLFLEQGCTLSPKTVDDGCLLCAEIKKSDHTIHLKITSN